MALHPLSTDSVIASDGKISETWKEWMNKLRSLVNNGETPSKDTNVTASNGIQLTSDYMRIQSVTAGAIVISANPQITKSTDGKRIIIEGLDAAKTVQISDGNGLKLTGGTPFVFAEGDSMLLHFNEDADLWIEDSRSKK